MSSTHNKSTASVSRGLRTVRIAGVAVAAGLFLGAPLVTTLAVAPGVAVADPGVVNVPNFDWLDQLSKCAKPYNNNDCDHDGVSNADETAWHTDPTDPKSVPKFDFDFRNGGNWNFGF